MTGRAPIIRRAPTLCLCAAALAFAAGGSGPAGTTGAAPDRPPLSEVRHINNGLLIAGLANEIRKKCDSISGRLIKGYFYLKSLERQALELGYSQAEIDAFVDSEADKDRLKAIGEKYLADNGVDREKPETLCAFGHREIARSSAIGALLRAR